MAASIAFAQSSKLATISNCLRNLYADYPHFSFLQSHCTTFLFKQVYLLSVGRKVLCRDVVCRATTRCPFSSFAAPRRTNPTTSIFFIVSRFQTTRPSIRPWYCLSSLSFQRIRPSRPWEYFYVGARACEETEIETKHTKHQWVPRRSKAFPHTALLNDLYLYITFHLPKTLIWHVSASGGQKDAA